MAVHYDISSLDSNKTILETLHDIQKYLKANPIYKVYYANGSYAIGQAQYSISLLGNNQGQIAEGDVVFFNNNFYAKISSVGTQTFSVFPATPIQGSGGAQIKTMSQLEFLNVLSLLYDDNAGAHINMSGRTEYTDGTETPNTLEVLIPFVPKDNSIKFETSEDFEKVKVSLNSRVVSNPNLLINPDFTINQRGQSSYTGTNIYTLDRWQIVGGTVEKITNGIKHTSTDTWQGIRQIIENPSKLAGKTLTISAKGKVSSGTFRLYLYSQKTGQSRVTVASNWTDSTTDKIISASGTIPSDITDSDTIYVMMYNSVANTSFWCEWAKLEIGELATEFVPPLIAEELPKCQRYYQKYNYSSYASIGIGIAYNSTTKLEMPFSYRQEMRTTPTASISGNFRAYNTNVYKIDLTLALNFTNNKSTTLLATSASGGFTTGNSYLIGPNGDAAANISLDAEIY